jgi:hypothetical protein
MHWLLALFSRDDPETSGVPDGAQPPDIQYRLGCDAIDWIFEGGQSPYSVQGLKQDPISGAQETVPMFNTSSSTYHYIMPPDLGMLYCVVLSIFYY